MAGSETSRGSAPAAPARRLAVIAPDWASLVRLRGDFIGHVLGLRHQVLCLAPDDQPAGEHATRLEAMGARIAGYPLVPEAPSLVADRRSFRVLAAKLADWRPHAVLAYGPRSMLLGAIAARRAGVPRIVLLVTRLAGELATDRPSWRWRRLALKAVAASHCLIFHNRADQRQLSRLGLLPARLPVTVVPGAGVDLERMRALPMPDHRRGLTFLMLSALRREKGVIEFCEAARLVRATRQHARFVLAGPEGGGPDAVSAQELGHFSGCVELRGEHDNIIPLLAEAHALVLPSWREGLSRTLLEALAAGRPIITTSIPGCRESVDERVNGILVPPRDPDALADAMASLWARPALLASMARASRLKAERLFDVREVNATLAAALGLA